MHVHPRIAALRSEPASQRLERVAHITAVDQWRDLKLTRAVASDLSDYAAGSPLEECKVLSKLLGDQQLALDWIGRWSALLIEAYQDDDLGEAPFRSSCTEGYATVQLLACDTATLNLTAYSPIEVLEAPQTALLVDRESVELLLVGEVQTVLHHFAEYDLRTPRVQPVKNTISAGETIALSRNSARHFIRSDCAILVLQLTRSAAVPRPTRKVCLADGKVLKSASGNKQASRDLMALAVLGVATDERSAQLFSVVAQDSARDIEVRWEAVRQLLAMDALQGLGVLELLAEGSCDVLAKAATSLKRQLQLVPMERHPIENEAA